MLKNINTTMNSLMSNVRVVELYSAIIALLTYMLAYVSFLWVAISLGNNQNESVLVVSSFMVPLLAACVPLFFVSQIFKDNAMSFRELIHVHNVPKNHIVRGVMIGVFLFIGYVSVVNLIVASGVTLSNSQSVDLLLNSNVLWVMLPFVCFIIPLVEELFFRGLLTSLLSRCFMFYVGIRWARVTGTLLVSALFALLHVQFAISSPVDLVVFGTTFTLGALCSLVMFKWDSVYPAVAVHATYNTISMILAIL